MTGCSQAAAAALHTALVPPVSALCSSSEASTGHQGQQADRHRGAGLPPKDPATPRGYQSSTALLTPPDSLKIADNVTVL